MCTKSTGVYVYLLFSMAIYCLTFPNTNTGVSNKPISFLLEPLICFLPCPPQWSSHQLLHGSVDVRIAGRPLYSQHYHSAFLVSASSAAAAAAAAAAAGAVSFPLYPAPSVHDRVWGDLQAYCGYRWMTYVPCTRVCSG